MPSLFDVYNDEKEEIVAFDRREMAEEFIFHLCR
jgi:hypothetical protein